MARAAASESRPRRPARILKATGLTRFHRTLRFDGARTFAVEDTIATTDAKTVQWFLHSDAPVQASGDRFLLGARLPGAAASVTAPAGSTTVAGTTN